MKLIKKSDPILITVRYGTVNVIDSLFASYDIQNDEEMTDPRALLDSKKANGEYGWTLCPADLHRVKVDDEGKLPDMINKKVRAKIIKCGYYWELRSFVQVPKRTSKSAKNTYRDLDV